MAPEEQSAEQSFTDEHFDPGLAGPSDDWSPLSWLRGRRNEHMRRMHAAPSPSAGMHL